MPLKQLNHTTIGYRPQHLPTIEDFHTGILGLTCGRRPDFNVPGSGDAAPVPGFPRQQLFLNDPASAKVERTFDMPEKA